MSTKQDTQRDITDGTIVATRMTKLDRQAGPRVGDYVEFVDGTVRRVSHIWHDGDIQTSDGGSFYLGNHGCQFSGSLHPSISADALTLTEEWRDGAIWIFHHDFPGAGRGVHFDVPFRVYETTENPT